MAVCYQTVPSQPFNSFAIANLVLLISPEKNSNLGVSHRGKRHSKERGRFQAEKAGCALTYLLTTPNWRAQEKKKNPPAATPAPPVPPPAKILYTHKSVWEAVWRALSPLLPPVVYRPALLLLVFCAVGAPPSPFPNAAGVFLLLPFFSASAPIIIAGFVVVVVARSVCRSAHGEAGR